MTQYIFKQNMIVRRLSRDYNILLINEEWATLQNVENKQHQVLSVLTLLQEYQLGDLTLPSFSDHLDYTLLTEQQITELRRFNTYLQFLDEQIFPSSNNALQLTINTAGNLLNEQDYMRPSISTLRRWYSKWTINNKQALYLLKSNIKQFSTTQSIRISEEMRLLINDVIDTEYLTLNGPNRAVCFKRLKLLHKRQGLQCKIVSRATFYRYVDKVDELTVISHRQGSVAAKKHARSATKRYEANGLFERCELDAVHINIYLIDLDGNIKGKPIVFLMIDVFSRCILGMHISIQNGETSDAAISTLRHAVLPKPTEKYHYLESKWACHGCPIELFVDSGSSFINASFDAILAQLKITRINGQSRQPWKRPHIERFNSTLRNKLKGIPGYIGKKSDNFEYDKPPKSLATLTLDEFERIVSHIIVDEYHQEPHAGINNSTPAQMWEKHIRYSPPFVPPNVEIFNVYMMKPQLGKIQQLKGIQYQYQFFNTNELKALYLTLKQHKLHNKKVTFLVDPDDASHITVINPFNQSLLKIPNTRKSSHARSFKELKRLSVEQMPNNTQKHIDEITQQAIDRKKKSARDKQKLTKKSTSDLTTFESTLTQDQIEAMMNKRNDITHKALDITNTENTLDVQQPSTPKIIKYKTN
ncbi:DNA-binding domain-containing protein [Shewanella frigidimarina]|uniref:DNA-binding domain-containing protein n=1 Tax=Shewanella frigidimarina TaxID=56812 RepID=UPI003D7A47C4